MAVTHPTASKPAGTWRYEDLFDLPDDGRRWEIIDGELYEMPAPDTAHAGALMNLIVLLVPTVAALGGRIFTAPLDAFFGGANPVQPDLLVVLPGSLDALTSRGVEGPPDLVVEVLSSSNRRHDLLTKRRVYAVGGVKEYWLVDPAAASIEVLALVGDAAQRHALATGDAEVTSRVLPGLSVRAASVFADELPR